MFPVKQNESARKKRIFYMHHYIIFCFNSKKINFSSLVVSCPRLLGKCRATRGERGKCAYTGKSSFRVCSLLPLPTANAATLAKAKRLTHFYSVAPLLEKWFACFPCAGTAFISYSFILIKNHL